MTTRESLAYPIRDAAAAIGVSRRKLYELIRGGELPSVKLGGRRLILRSDIVALLQSARSVALSPASAPMQEAY